MKQDQSYRYFQESLSRWIKKQKEEGEAPQKIIALKANVTEGTVSKYLSKKRTKPIPFEMQVAFAEACGYEYFEFLKKGKESLEAGVPLKEVAESHSPVQNISQLKNERHHELIDSFQDHQKALELNRILVQIERTAGGKGLAMAQGALLTVASQFDQEDESTDKTGTEGN